jgi:chromosome segregation ATPase
LTDAEGALPARKRATRLNYEDLGRAVVDRLLALARDDGLRAAQVEVFASEAEAQRARTTELEETIQAAAERETDLRTKLKAAEEALDRAEENLRRAFGPQRPPRSQPVAVEDDEARAVLDVLRSGHA